LYAFYDFLIVMMPSYHDWVAALF